MRQKKERNLEEIQEGRIRRERWARDEKEITGWWKNKKNQIHQDINKYAEFLNATAAIAQINEVINSISLFPSYSSVDNCIFR